MGFPPDEAFLIAMVVERADEELSTGSNLDVMFIQISLAKPRHMVITRTILPFAPKYRGARSFFLPHETQIRYLIYI